MVKKRLENIPSLEGVRVLFVENDRPIAEFLLMILEAANAEVIKANSTDTALSQLSEQAIDVLICNIQLPGMHGLELVQEMRSRTEKHISQLPAIATATTVNDYSQAIAARTAASAGFNQFIPLPTAPEKIVNTILDLAGKVRD